MTLHWWMHWFWVTSLITLHASTGTAAPQSEDITETPADLPRPSDRQPRAMYYGKTTAPPTLPPNITETTPNNITDTDPIQPVQTNTTTPILNTTDIVHPSVIWTSVNTTELNRMNETESETNTTLAPKKRNQTRPDVIKDDINNSAAESRIVTEKPLSLETVFHQTRLPPNIESSRRVIDQNDGMDTGAIAGISFAALVLVALAGSTAFVLYRRRYLNKPQTLNDKCSNPDSSGYLDDSTIRDNSEEMYSLDNDSFLNSLEAMTIQNYWTDTVKHTKL